MVAHERIPSALPQPDGPIATAMEVLNLVDGTGHQNRQSRPVATFQSPRTSSHRSENVSDRLSQLLYVLLCVLYFEDTDRRFRCVVNHQDVTYLCVSSRLRWYFSTTREIRKHDNTYICRVPPCTHIPLSVGQDNTKESSRACSTTELIFFMPP